MSDVKNDPSHKLEHHEEMDIEALDQQKNPQVLVDSYVPGTEAEKKLVRKIDFFLMPCIFFMYLLSYMDRTNIGNAKVAGMEEDLELTSNRYSIALVVFFVGYVVFEVPSNMLLSRWKPSLFLPTIMLLWGCVTISMGWIPNYQTLIGIRALVGVLEAGFAPGVLLVISSWYKKSEQSQRFAIYISAAILSGAFGGILGGAITGDLDGVHGIEGWRWLFIVEGAATVGWALISYYMLLDFPANTMKFTEEERRLAIARLAAEEVRTDSEDTVQPGHLEALKIALRNWRVWLFVVGYMAVVGSSTLSYFYPTLVAGLGYEGTTIQYMTIPIYVCAWVCTIITGFFLDRKPHLRGLVIGCWMTVACVCAILICCIYEYKARYALLCISASGLWVSNGMSLAYASSTFGPMPNEVRAIALAFVNAMGNLAQIYGSYLFPEEDEPKYLMGFGVIAGLCFTGLASYFALYVLLKKYPQR